MEENKLTNTEIAKVFAMYWGNVSFLNGINGMPILSLFDCNDICLGRIKCKLLLTPLSSITDEHAVEVAKINLIHTDNHYLVGKSLIHWLLKEGTNRDLSFEAYQYLISKGYAVPLWFGISHWANGKTAIELGIAIDKTLK